MTEQETPVSLTWQTTLADLLTLLLVFIITERCNLLPNPSSSLGNEVKAGEIVPAIHGTNLALYNPLERLTYLISCEETKGLGQRLISDLKTLQDSQEITRITVLRRKGVVDRCAKSVMRQLFDTAPQSKIFTATGSQKESVAVLVDVRYQHG